MYPLDVGAPTRLTLRWQSYVDDPVQGLIVRSREGHITVAGQVRKSFVFWTDTAPSVVELECQPTKGAMRLWLYNCWREVNGGVMSNLGAAAMRVTQTDSTVLLHASDYTQPPSFDDLVVSVEQER